MGWDSMSEVGLRASEIVGPSGVLRMSQWVRSVFKRDCAPSRAIPWSSESERMADVVASWFGSVAERWERS